MKATGPTISALQEINMLEQLMAFNLEKLNPRYMDYPDALKVVKTKSEFPDPKEATSSAPEVISYSFVIPGVEPTLGFEDFIRGVACASILILPEYQDAIQSALVTVAERVINTGSLPALNSEFATELNKASNTILSNGEPSGWRGLLSFAQGAYWLLGFIEEPNKKRKGKSPIEYVEEMVLHFGALGYVPR